VDEQESLQRAIYEEVRLVPYEPHWPALFELERDRLLRLFPTQLLSIEHFGSTAVPHMPAKPVIDLLGGVASMQAADALIEPLLQSLYTTSAAFNASLTDRRWLMRWADGHRTHHLHLVVMGGTEWQRLLRFRDLLRSDRDLARRYAAHKMELVVRHGGERDAYTNAKTDFVLAALQSAGS
jgi:GrpB-like predicted nucleotidyltransferase (UPF0157 family)